MHFSRPIKVKCNVVDFHKASVRSVDTGVPRSVRWCLDLTTDQWYKGSALHLFRQADFSSPEDLDREPLSGDGDEPLTL